MFTCQHSVVKRVSWIALILFLVLSCFGGAYAAGYSLRSGSETVTLKSIRSSGSTIFISLEFKNNGSTGESFLWNYGIEVWQNGRKCEDDYSGNRNTSEEIKDGAAIEVTKAYKLRDLNSIVEVDVSESFVWTANEFKVFFNPKTQKWGTRAEVNVTTTATPKPTSTPTPTATPTPTSSPKPEASEGLHTMVWHCPSCGKELTSKFCPDCGTTSPTPQPTATPTPSPTPVPMDLSKPVENVVKYAYTVYEDDYETTGIYTGEIVDGFPHGYGVFESSEWIYVGDWNCGVKKDDGHTFFLYPGNVSRDAYYSVGNYVTFGSYPQTKEGNDNTPIEWLVLARDGEKVLLLSRYGLDVKPYHTSSADTTWEQCSLREWLNSEFINEAFSENERTGILIADVDNSRTQGYSKWSKQGGNNTQDRVFLLSYAEANKYLNVTFGNSNYTKARVAPTAYAITQGAHTTSSDKTADGTESAWWWLRSPGSRQDIAAGVGRKGTLGSKRVNDDSGCIRPALWINLESGNF